MSFNGQKIYNLSQLVGLVDACKDEYLMFDLDYNQKVSTAPTPLVAWAPANGGGKAAFHACNTLFVGYAFQWAVTM